MRRLHVVRLVRFSAILGITFMIGVGCASAPTLEGEAESLVADYRALVSDTVVDADRRHSAEAMVDEMADEIGQLYRGLGDIQSDLFELNANYDTTREEFDVQLRRARDLRARVSERLIELGQRLRAQVTADEWREIHSRLAEYGTEEAN